MSNTEQEHSTSSPDKNRKSTSKLAAKLLLTSSLMFGFGYALVPLYSFLCDITGLGGKANNNVQIAADAVDDGIDYSREVTVELIANNYYGSEWGFKPEVTKLTVHPGQFIETNYYATNLSSENNEITTSYNLAPAESSLYFQKIQCFCFTVQDFAPNEEKKMPVIFRVRPDVPEKMSTITLAYQLNKVTS